MGYYGGKCARLVARVPAVGSLNGIQQADCPTAPDTGMTDCGAWVQDPAAVWDLSSTPTPVTSGIYFAKAVRDDGAGASHLFFVVRNDASTSDVIVKTSDTTWQAYNSYGGNSFYVGGATPAAGSNPARAYKLSYNRPFNTRGNGNARNLRFSPDGGRPENAVSGQIFTVDCCSAPTGFVPPADGRMRFWRNTDVATLAASNVTAQLPAGVIGYEWDEDLDNGARPAGIVRMSSTTVNPVDAHLFDYGNTFALDIATHHLTLYRHASGALVFGAGSIQWSWGLDSDPDLNKPVPSLSMQQAMVNLFAD